MQTCPHITTDDDAHLVCFTGRGKEHYLACLPCAAGFPVPPPELVDATQELIDSFSVFSCEGARGTPEVLTRDAGLSFAHEDFPSPLPPDERVIDIVPDMCRPEEWICLTASGKLFRLNIRRQQAQEIVRWNEIGFELDDEVSLCLSPRSDFGAVCETSGRLGFAFDLHSGAITIRLDRGEYRPDNSRFPVAFFQHAWRTLLVAATDWNRLDILDPATGTVLTGRENVAHETGKPRPEHYLDYFHAQVLVSPNSNWIVDNGWVWHPVGIIRSWNLPDWLEKNPWESEDGPSINALASREYYWDGPICWTDDTTVAIWGWGTDDDYLVPAVRLIDAPSGREPRWFPGPQVRPARAWPPKKVAPSLFFDKYLFSVSNEFGTAIWDIRSEERLHLEPSFFPIQYHPASRDFLSMTSGGFRLSRVV